MHFANFFIECSDKCEHKAKFGDKNVLENFAISRKYFCQIIGIKAVFCLF